MGANMFLSIANCSSRAKLTERLRKAVAFDESLQPRFRMARMPSDVPGAASLPWMESGFSCHMFTRKEIEA